MANWYLYDAAGVAQGPYEADALKRLAAAGTITPETRIVRNGKEARAKNVKGLFPDAPPPVEPPESFPVPPPAPKVVEKVFAWKMFLDEVMKDPRVFRIYVATTVILLIGVIVAFVIAVKPWDEIKLDNPKKELTDKEIFVKARRLAINYELEKAYEMLEPIVLNLGDSASDEWWYWLYKIDCQLYASKDRKERSLLGGKYLRLETITPAMRYTTANLLASDRKFHEARVKFCEVLNDCPFDHEAKVKIGVTVLMDRNSNPMEAEAAIQFLNSAILEMPDYAEAYSVRASLNHLLGDYDKAITDINLAIKPGYKAIRKEIEDFRKN